MRLILRIGIVAVPHMLRALGILVDLDASAPVGALEGKFLVDDCGLRWWTGQAPSFSSTKPEPFCWIEEHCF